MGKLCAVWLLRVLHAFPMTLFAATMQSLNPMVSIRCSPVFVANHTHHCRKLTETTQITNDMYIRLISFAVLKIGQIVCLFVRF